VRKLLIADSSDAFANAVFEQLGRQFEIICCNDGREVLPLLFTFSPDLMLLDLMMPGYDGLTILEAAVAAGKRPVVLAVCRVFGMFVQNSLDRLGICYAMQKPCDINCVCNRILELANYQPQDVLPKVEEEYIVDSMLRTLGISNKHMGYRCLMEAVQIIAKDPDQLYTKELYPEVGRMLGCGWKQVERDIRTAIEAAWLERDEQLWAMIFPNYTDMPVKPTNSAFISCLGRLLRNRDY